MLYAWTHRLARAGIVTYYTTNYTETAKLLVSIFKNEQKPPDEHKTLTRVIKPRLDIKIERDSTGHIKEAEPLMRALMFLSDAYKLGIGEKKAKALCDRYCNLIDLATADVSEIAQTEGIGITIANRLLVALGRTL
jgi:ERCC4-type nuclease